MKIIREMLILMISAKNSILKDCLDILKVMRTGKRGKNSASKENNIQRVNATGILGEKKENLRLGQHPLMVYPNNQKIEVHEEKMEEENILGIAEKTSKVRSVSNTKQDSTKIKENEAEANMWNGLKSLALSKIVEGLP